AQIALRGGQQACEEEAADAVIDDRRPDRGAGEREARIGKLPRREEEDVAQVSSVRTSRLGKQWPESHLALSSGHAVGPTPSRCRACATGCPLTGARDCGADLRP